MDLHAIYERRRVNLRRLINERFDGVVLRFAESLGIKPPQVHRWLSPTPKSRHNLTEGSARDIEDRVGLPHGWLDRPENAPDYLAATDDERLLLTAYRIIPPDDRASLLQIVLRLRDARHAGNAAPATAPAEPAQEPLQEGRKEGAITRPPVI